MTVEYLWQTVLQCYEVVPTALTIRLIDGNTGKLIRCRHSK